MQFPPDNSQLLLISQNPILQNPILQNPILQNPSSQNSISQNPISEEALDLYKTILQNFIVQNPILQHPVLQNPVSLESRFAEPHFVVIYWIYTGFPFIIAVAIVTIRFITLGHCIKAAMASLKGNSLDSHRFWPIEIARFSYIFSAGECCSTDQGHHI